MALQSLDQRLNELGAIQGEVAQSPLTPDIVPVDPVELVEEPQSFEPVQTAGLFGAIVKAPFRKEAKILPAGKEAAKVGPYQVISETEAAAKAQQILKAAPTAPVSGRPSPTQAQAAAGVEQTIFNLDKIDGPDSLKQFIESTGAIYGADKIERISYKSIAEEAGKLGYDEAFLAKIIDTTQATQADPKEAFKMLLALTDSGDRASKLAEAVVAAKAAGNLTDDLATEFQQAVALQGALAKAVKGRSADIARTLGVFSQTRSLSANRGDALRALLAETGGIKSVHDFASKYLALDSRTARTNMAAAGYSDDLGGMYERTKDIWFSTWINGILSSPVTHAKNIAGNLFFGAYSQVETGVAAGIGAIRRGVFRSTEESISADELYSRAFGMLQGIVEGAVISGRAFAKNAPTDAFQKIESGRYGRNPFEVDYGDSFVGKSLSNVIKYWGAFTTLPGRALMAEDEFFKAVAYRVELNGLAAREAKRKFRSLVEDGVDVATAEQTAIRAMQDTLVNPSDEIMQSAQSASRTLTFTQELPESLRGLQDIAQNPFIKMFMPFIKTPTNIILETSKRSPLAIINPQVWSDIGAGGVRQDMAIARVTLGSGLIAAGGYFALQGRMTGYGPMRDEDKKGMVETGWQPFSIVLSKDSVSPEMLAKFNGISKVSVGEKNIYISYAGLEPLATLLGIAASSGEYSMLSAGQADMEKMVMGGATGLYKYLAEAPMLQGFNEMSKVLTSREEDVPSFLYDLMFRMSKQVSSFAIGGSPAGVHSSMLAAVERVMYPEQSNLMREEMGQKHSIVDAGMEGFWTALRQAKSRNPFTSNTLPVELDSITGETKRVGMGNFYELWSPFKKSDGKFSEAHTVLIQYGVPAYQPNKIMDGVILSAKQMNRWKELATKDGALADRIAELGNGSALIEKAGRDLLDAQNILKKEISDAYANAKKILLIEDKDLSDAIRDAKDEQLNVGKYKY